MKKQNNENNKNPKKSFKQVLVKVLGKVKDAIHQEGEYKKDETRINTSKKDLERIVVITYFIAYLLICGFGITSGINYDSVLTLVFSTIKSVIGTHLFFGICGLIAYIILKEYGEKYIRIYDEFEKRKEKVEKIYKPEGSKCYVVETKNRKYNADLSGGKVILMPKNNKESTNHQNSKKPSNLQNLKEESMERIKERPKKRPPKQTTRQKTRSQKRRKRTQ